MTRPKPEAQVFSRCSYLYNHLKGEHASENVVKIPQHLEDTHMEGKRLCVATRPYTLPLPTETHGTASPNPHSFPPQNKIVSAGWMQGGEEPWILLEPCDLVTSPWPVPPLGQNLTSCPTNLSPALAQDLESLPVPILPTSLEPHPRATSRRCVCPRGRAASYASP